MNNEYIIINKSLLEKRMGELIKESNSGKILSSINSQMAESLIRFKEEILSQSTPLIPEIEKAHKKGFTEGTCFGATTIYKYETSEDYISNLKLDI
jgi:hypothetical protein